jgi:Uncharacterized protein conserved in bacteria
MSVWLRELKNEDACANDSSAMNPSEKPTVLSFESILTRISDEMEYYALEVPEKITRALGTLGPVPVSARVNDSKPFLVSLYTRGGGRHGIRIKAAVRKETGIREGDRVRIEITVIDREKVEVPEDLLKALRAAGVENAFKAITPGKRNYLIRLINAAARAETRAKRVQESVTEAEAKSRVTR